MPGQWRLVPERISLRRWDDQCVIFNEFSLDTHLVDSLVGDLIDGLQHGPKTESELFTLLAGNRSLTDSLDFSWLQQTLLELKDNYLVEPVE